MSRKYQNKSVIFLLLLTTFACMSLFASEPDDFCNFLKEITKRLKNLEDENVKLKKKVKKLSEKVTILEKSSIPIGSIISYSGKLENLSSCYVPCDGRIVQDKESSYYGKKTPDLRGLFIKCLEEGQICGQVIDKGPHTHKLDIEVKVGDPKQAGKRHKLEFDLGRDPIPHVHNVEVVKAKSAPAHSDPKHAVFHFLVRVK